MDGPSSVGDSVGAQSPSMNLAVECLLNMESEFLDPQQHLNDPLSSAAVPSTSQPLVSTSSKEPEPGEFIFIFLFF